MLNLWMDPAFESLVKEPREGFNDVAALRNAIVTARQKADSSWLSGFDLEIEDREILPSGEEKNVIPIRIYRSKSAEGLSPVLLYLHGGGFFCGDVFSEQMQCVQYAVNARCTVVCVAYRLAPEDPFPAGLNDCYRALEFLWDHSQELRLDRNRIAVGGSSAGANLAAAVALLARDRTGPKICFQLLLIPALDDRLETGSAMQFIDTPDFARSEAEVMWHWYLGETPQDVSPYAAPARAKDLSNLPSAYILCAGLDPLRDEGLDYANRLSESGVAVELHLVPSIPHGFAGIPSAAISERLLREQVEVLRSAFAREKAACDAGNES
ncbi:alpha/beta fold hydrolase [Granulicella sp. S190]|uniref:alpha/beta fold hydrolase n=1 Tax=Granulicella sp. S190 TaxID=1747226 RepID=UPI00131BAAD1|nr:alpha/beta fold hydrolase [Granulicella sp. S190]